MLCPKCGFQQADGGLDCIKCGVIFAKWKDRANASPAAPVPSGKTQLKRPVQAAKVGIFDDIPCPQCGAPTTARSESKMMEAKDAIGLWGTLLVHAFTSKRYCPEHGEISSETLPPEHQSVVTMKKVMTALSGVGVLVVCLAILIALQ